MKRIIFSIVAIGAIALTSCKKDEVASTELGMAKINGTVRADIDQTNDVNALGLYSAYSMPENVEGLTVKVEVNTQDWVQNPESGYNYDKKVYMATTDASGKFTLEIPATEEGYWVSISFEDKHGVTRKMFTNDGSTLEVDSYISRANASVYIYSGGTIDKVYDANITAENNNANQYGSATIKGAVYVSGYDQGLTPSAGNILLDAASPFPAREILIKYYNTPYGLSNNENFSFTVDANGNYTATIPTETAGANSVGVYIGAMEFIGDLIFINAAFTADSTWQGKYTLSNANPLQQLNTTLVDGQIVTGMDLVFNGGFN